MKVEQNHMLSGSVEEFTLKIVSSGNAFCDSLWQATKLSPPYSRLYYIEEGDGQIYRGVNMPPFRQGGLLLNKWKFDALNVKIPCKS